MLYSLYLDIGKISFECKFLSNFKRISITHTSCRNEIIQLKFFAVDVNNNEIMAHNNDLNQFTKIICDNFYFTSA